MEVNLSILQFGRRQKFQKGEVDLAEVVVLKLLQQLFVLAHELEQFKHFSTRPDLSY